jgi:glycine/D-amino acid oxidase-like deaminating enzyme
VSDAVVIGSGVFGAWTAHFLAAGGARVTLVDAYGAGNSRSSSGDESRILRCGYGRDEIYSRFAHRSRALWRELDARIEPGLPLWHPCGVLWLASAGDAYVADTLETLRSGGYAVEVLDRTALGARYPHLAADGIEIALLEPAGGVVMARRSIQALTAELSRARVIVRRGQALGPSAPGPVTSVRLADGTDLSGGLFVFACGAWLPAVFPELLGQRIVPTRQAVMYFGAAPGDDRFTGARMPAWIDFGSGIYGIPDLENRGVKVGIDAHGARFDPDTGDRTVDPASIDMAREWLGRRFPALAGAPMVESRVCQYENTSSGDFLIDRHPDHDNVWIVGGGSGHGFKHGPAVGEYAARLMTTSSVPDARFALQSKATVAGRVVF